LVHWQKLLFDAPKYPVIVIKGDKILLEEEVVYHLMASGTLACIEFGDPLLIEESDIIK